MRSPAASRNAPHRMVRALAAAVLLSVGGAAHVSASGPGADVAEFLPPDDPAWEDLESLWNRGGLPGLPVFTRPLPRMDVAKALAAMRQRRPDLAALGAGRRLERELAFELARLDAGTVAETRPFLEAVEGDDSLLRVRTGLRAAATTTDDTGEVLPGTRGGIVLRAYLPGGAFAQADVSVEKIVDGAIGDAIVKNSDWYLSTDDAYLSWRTAALDFRAGFATSRWGPGSSGTLLLSDAAMSYPAIEMSRTLGARARAVALVGWLHQPEPDPADPGRAGPGLQFAAHRIELGLGAVRLGLHEAAAYRADGPELLYAVGVVPYTLVQRWLDRATAEGVSNQAHRNNVLVGADIAWRIGRGWRVDGELLIDDFATESSSQPDRIGYGFGASWAGVAAGRAADARAEFVKVYRYTYSTFYHADLVLDGVPLGYGGGPDVEHAEAWAERDLGTSLRLGAGLDWTRHGEGFPGEAWDPEDGGTRESGSTLSGVVERRVFPHVRFRGTWRDVADLRVQAGILRTTNAGHAEGADDTSMHLRAEARWEW